MKSWSREQLVCRLNQLNPESGEIGIKISSRCSDRQSNCRTKYFEIRNQRFTSHHASRASRNISRDGLTTTMPFSSEHKGHEMRESKDMVQQIKDGRLIKNSFWSLFRVVLISILLFSGCEQRTIDQALLIETGCTNHLHRTGG